MTIARAAASEKRLAVNPQAKRYAAAVETVADLAWKQAESTGLR